MVCCSRSSIPRTVLLFRWWIQQLPSLLTNPSLMDCILRRTRDPTLRLWHTNWNLRSWKQTIPICWTLHLWSTQSKLCSISTHSSSMGSLLWRTRFSTLWIRWINQWILQGRWAIPISWLLRLGWTISKLLLLRTIPSWLDLILWTTRDLTLGLWWSISHLLNWIWTISIRSILYLGWICSNFHWIWTSSYYWKRQPLQSMKSLSLNQI